MLFYPTRRGSAPVPESRHGSPRPLSTGESGDAMHLTWMLKSFVMGIALLGLSYWLVQIAGVQYLASLTSATLLAFLLAYVVWCLLHKNRHTRQNIGVVNSVETGNNSATFGGNTEPLTPTPPPPFDHHQAYKFTTGVPPRDCSPPPSYEEAIRVMMSMTASAPTFMYQTAPLPEPPVQQSFSTSGPAPISSELSVVPITSFARQSQSPIHPNVSREGQQTILTPPSAVLQSEAPSIAFRMSSTMQTSSARLETLPITAQTTLDSIYCIPPSTRPTITQTTSVSTLTTKILPATTQALPTSDTVLSLETQNIPKTVHIIPSETEHLPTITSNLPIEASPHIRQALFPTAQNMSSTIQHLPLNTQSASSDVPALHSIMHDQTQPLTTSSTPKKTQSSPSSFHEVPLKMETRSSTVKTSSLNLDVSPSVTNSIEITPTQTCSTVTTSCSSPSIITPACVCPLNSESTSVSKEAPQLLKSALQEKLGEGALTIAVPTPIENIHSSVTEARNFPLTIVQVPNPASIIVESTSSRSQLEQSIPNANQIGLTITPHTSVQIETTLPRISLTESSHKLLSESVVPLAETSSPVTISRQNESEVKDVS